MDSDREEPPTKKIKRNSGKEKNKKSKEKIPTRQQLTQLKENETLYQSSLFRLQIDELLAEVRLKNSKTKQFFLSWFEDIKQYIYSDKSQDNVDLTNNECTLLFPVLSRCTKNIKRENICYHPPEKIKLVGSFPLDLAIKSTLSVDVMIQIPKKCFYNDDNLNLRYFHKRALYISHLAKILKKADNLIEEIHYEYHHGDQLKPIIVIKPKGSLSNVTVKLLACPPSDHFQLSKLKPFRNNVRYEWFKGEKRETESPTPHYNSSMLSDILMESCFEYLQNTLPTTQNISGGILLLKVWLHQRQLDQGFGCISNFILTSFVAHLLQVKKLNQLMSSYQVARTVWLALSQSDWTSSRNEQLNSDDFFLHFPVVFVDSTSSFNLCSNVTKSTYLRLKHEAELSLKFADSASNFDALFMQPVPFIRKFDHILKIEPGIKYSSIIQKYELTDQYPDYVGDEKCIILPTLTDILFRGLGERIDLLEIKLSSPIQWELDELPSVIDNGITIGFLLNPDHYCDVLDKGPSAETEEAKEFREFWGSKSDLRRFKDTTICEAVTWPSESMCERRVVCSHIVKFILNRHLNIRKKFVQYIANQVDPFVSVKLKFPVSNLPQSSTGEELMMNIINVLDRLRKEIQKLNHLPLAITSVQGVSPSFRYSEIFPPLPFNSCKQRGNRKTNYLIPNERSEKAPYFVQTLDVVITLEGSNKWPNDAEAVKRIKAAFYMKLTKLIKEQCQVNCVGTTEFVVVFKEGFLFCITIGYKRESTLMKMEKTVDGVLKFIENDKSRIFEKDIIQLPKISSVLHGLQLQQGSFSCACRLAKRWISSQLFADHVSDVTIELTMAHIFIYSGSYTIPKSPQVAFQRWLHLIARHNWKTLPLIVNFNNELTADDLTEITNKFAANRDNLPALFVATPYDKFKSCWSKNAPCLPVLIQLVKLAEAGLQLLESELENSCSPDLTALFRPCLVPYHAMIYLNIQQVPKNHCAVKKIQSFNNEDYEQKNYELIPIFGYDPVEYYLKELRNTFDDHAVFFYDKYGGDTIAVLWKSKTFEPTELKVSRLNCKKPADLEHENDNKIVVDVKGIVEDFKIFGKGLVKSVSVKDDGLIAIKK